MPVPGKEKPFLGQQFLPCSFIIGVAEGKGHKSSPLPSDIGELLYVTAYICKVREVERLLTEALDLIAIHVLNIQ